MSTLVIAEGGVNACGNLDVAIEITAAAARAGANAIKWQLFDPEHLAPGDFKRRALLKAHHTTRSEMTMLAAEAEREGLEFMATAFDAGSLAWLCQNDMIKRIKIGSGQVSATWSHDELWGMAALSRLPLIVSNGMCFDSELSDRLRAIEAPKTVMYCVSKYPTPETQINLSEMQSIPGRIEGVDIGFSSHCRSFWPSVAAVACGAVVIEAHLALPGCASPDAGSSLLPDEFAAMVREIRVAEAGRG